MSLPTGSSLELSLTPHDLLTNEDMVALTGATRADIQAQVLASNNIFFIIDYKLTPKTTWFHVNNPIHLRTPTLSMSDFGYGFSKSFQLKPEKGFTAGRGKEAHGNAIFNFLEKIFQKVDSKIPEHIKSQIERNKKQHAEMANIAERVRRERKENPEI